MWVRPTTEDISRKTDREDTMGADDKARAKTEEIVGKGKETLGSATGDESMEREGEAEQSKANLKQAGEKVKDAFKKD
jgi:uncharacterized protein YjbJ (UPF0337 family)